MNPNPDRGEHTCTVLASNGTVRCWGFNYLRQIGDGTTLIKNTPAIVPGLGLEYR